MSCPNCIPCAEHALDEDDDEDEGPEHECTANSADPCDNCRKLDKQAEDEQRESERLAAVDADFKLILAGVKRLIERNGYCVVCERYAPFHLIDCPILRHK